MRWWVLWIATAATCLGQSSNSGDRNREHKERMEHYDRMNAELSASINDMRQQSELQQQTEELREQTRLLEKMSESASAQVEASSYSAPAYVLPRSVVRSTPIPMPAAMSATSVAASLAVVDDPAEGEALPAEYEFLRPYMNDEEYSRTNTPAKFDPDEFIRKYGAWTNEVEWIDPPDPLEVSKRTSALRIAQNRQNFSGLRMKPVSGVVSDPVEEDSNSQLITEWIKNYAGEFSDYGWLSEPIDAQTFLVVCEVSLDGEKHDFKFQVNTELMTCRYKGGTAYEKLRSNQRKTSWLPW